MAAENHEELRVQAGRVAGQSNLRDIRLTSSQLELVSVPEPGAPLEVALDVSPEAQISSGTYPDPHLILVNCSFDVSISREDSSDSAQVANIRSSFTAAFTADSDNDFSDQELQAFANSTGVFAIYPYAREYVSDCTRRLGLPTLVLDLFKQ
ncbi:protein-export chaperone SecB [uncultured Corynebacterium sp.]|uniref:protein-export chaperone SecB n=1 Tax=uncultured Corynebacterium sp. TaxID=159447 RepID=UPI0025EF424B|nr:protein-export chaperone SecB [uncultured Corynebacterium sp.]